MQQIVTILCIVITSFVVFAKTDCIIVQQKSEDPVVIPFETASEIQFSGDNLMIGEYIFPLATIKRYEFGDLANINKIMIIFPETLVIDPSGIITFPEGTDMRKVKIYNLKGIECSYVMRDQKIDFSNYSPGIYVIKYGNQSFKMVKR